MGRWPRRNQIRDLPAFLTQTREKGTQDVTPAIFQIAEKEHPATPKSVNLGWRQLIGLFLLATQPLAKDGVTS